MLSLELIDDNHKIEQKIFHSVPDKQIQPNIIDHVITNHFLALPHLKRKVVNQALNSI